MNTSKLVAVLFLMIFFFYSLPICSGDSNNSELKKFNEIFNEDLKKIKQYRAGLNEITGFLRKSDIISPKPKNYMFSLDERILLKNLWGACLDYNSALNSIRKNYQIEFFKKKEGEKIKKFLMNYSVFLAQYRFALDFIGILDSNKNIDTLLNESVVESGVEENSFADFKFEFLNVMKAAQFAAYEFIYKEFYNKRICSELEILINEDSNYIWKSGKGKGGKLTLKNAFKIIVDAGHKIWLPVQQESANIMSEIKVYRKDANLITKEQIQSVIGKINPGDILFERREWYLTNIGIPGYWTHAALYIGTPEERKKYFSQDDISEWLKLKNASSFEDVLNREFHEAYRLSRENYADGFPVRIIEAIGAGVSFTSLEHSGCADSLGVLRPKLDKNKIAEAILRAYKYHGSPYDYDFDFVTDNSLVCSELVYKAYEGNIEFPEMTVLNKILTPPNEIVKMFSVAGDKTNNQFEFVLFFDGSEKLKKSVVSDQSEFRQSWKRPKWHILKTAR